MATLHATLISDDDYKKNQTSKGYRSSSTGPSKSAVNRNKDSVSGRSSGGYMIPTQTKDSSKRSSS